MIGKEINLLENYPKTERDPNKRREQKTEEHRAIARKFEKDFLMVIEKLVTGDLVMTQNIGPMW